MKITTESIMLFNPCAQWPRKRVRAFFGDREWTPQEVLRLPVAQVCAVDRWWVVTRPGVLDDAILRRTARWCALSVVHLWSPPEEVATCLRSGDAVGLARAAGAAGAAWAALEPGAAWEAEAQAARAAWAALEPGAAWAAWEAEAQATRAAGAALEPAAIRERHCSTLAGWLDRVDAGEVLPLEISEEEYRCKNE